MTFPDLTGDLADRLPDLRGRMTANASMADLTWFRVGGPAQVLFTPVDADDLAYFLALTPADLPVMAVGVGSNLIVRDGGVPGVVIRLSSRGFGAVEVQADGTIRAGTAALDKKVAEVAQGAGQGGLEFFFGIPGSIGGALRMNAGANGGETRDVFVSADAVTRTGERLVLTPADMGFAYRTCAAPADVIFTSATFRGVPASADDIAVKMKAVQEHRERAQPIRSRTGGSTFKNPPGHSAWKLIDAAGCRGLRRGGAQVSELHCNFLINTGGATAADVEGLGEEVRARVKAATGIELHWEIKRIGIA